MSMEGIDVSIHNTIVDFARVKTAGKQFCIVKASQGRELYGPNPYQYPFEDPKFTMFVDGAYASDLICGSYHFMTGETLGEVNAEANFFVSSLNKRKSKLILPAFIDCELGTYTPSRKDEITGYVLQFARIISKHGYIPGIAAYHAFYLSCLDFSRLNDIRIWVSWYNAVESNVLSIYPNAITWQKSGTGTCDGISGLVDLHTGYFDRASEPELTLVNPGSLCYIDYARRYVVIPKETTPTVLMTYIGNSSGSISIVKAKSDSDYCGTGSQVNVKVGGVVKKSYTVVVLGDLNGDGKINAADYIMVQRHLAGTLSPALNECQTYAADFNEDGIADEADVTAIRNEILHVEG